MDPRQKKYLELETQLLPDTKYINHETEYWQNLLKPLDEITVKSTVSARHRLKNSCLVETNLDIDSEDGDDNLTTQKQIIQCATNIIITGEKELSIPRGKWLCGISGKGMHLHLITNVGDKRICFEHCLVKAAGIPLINSSKKEGIGIDKRVINEEWLIRVFGSKHRELQYYKTFLPVDLLFRLKKFLPCNSPSRVCYPPELPVHKFSQEDSKKFIDGAQEQRKPLKDILEVLKDPEAPEDLRGKLVLYLKNGKHWSEERVLDYIMKNAQWADKNQEQSKKKVHDWFSRYENLPSKKKLAEEGYTYNLTHYNPNHYNLTNNNGYNGIFVNNNSNLNNNSNILNKAYINRGNIYKNVKDSKLIKKFPIIFPKKSEEYYLNLKFEHRITKAKGKQNIGITIFTLQENLGTRDVENNGSKIESEELKKEFLGNRSVAKYKEHLLGAYIWKRHGRGIDWDIRENFKGEGYGVILLSESPYRDLSTLIAEYTQKGLIDDQFPLSVVAMRYGGFGIQSKIIFEIIPQEEAILLKDKPNEEIISRIEKFDEKMKELQERWKKNEKS